MRLLHVVPTYYPAVRYGGPIRSVHGLCAALAARGHEVHVFTTNVDGPGDSDVPLEAPVSRDGVRVRYFPSRRLRRLYWSPPMGAALRQEVATFDLVHLHSVFLWPNWAAAGASRHAKIPYVLSPRGMLVRDLIRRRSMLAKSAWIAVIERRNVERASGIHLTSDLELQELQKFGFRLPLAKVIANGIDTAVPMSSRSAVSPDVADAMLGGEFALYLGRLSWKKRLVELVRAIAAEPRLRLVIAGNDDEEHTVQLRQWIAEAGLGNRAVLISRFVDGSDKAALLSKAAVFVLPSLSENFGVAALEAMGAGCPVVVSEGVGLAATVETANAGIVAAPGALSAALSRIADQPALRAAMGRNARRAAVDSFGWPRIAAEMEIFYRTILGRGGSRAGGR